MDAERLLGCVCSADCSARERSIQLIINLSYSNPGKILSVVTELRLVVVSMCSGPDPDWGTVSSLLFAVANAMSIVPDNLQECICEIIGMSRVVTDAFLRITGNAIFKPDLSAIVKSILFVFEIKKVKPSLEILLEIVEHCRTGFIESYSLLPILLGSLEEFAEILRTTDFSNYDSIAAPLSSSDCEIEAGFMQLWIGAISGIRYGDAAVEALILHLRSMCDLARLCGTPWTQATTVLLEFIKGNVPKPEVVAKVTEKCKEYKFEKRTQKGETAKDKKPKPRETHKALVTWKKGKKKRPVEMVLVEEAEIITWRKKNKGIKKGHIICVGSLVEISIQAGDESQTENVLKLRTKKDEFLFAFRSSEECQRWNSLIQAVKESCDVI